MFSQFKAFTITLLFICTLSFLHGQVQDSLFTDTVIIKKPVPCLPTQLNANNIRSNTATLNATLCKNHAEISEYYFIYTDPTGNSKTIPVTITNNGNQIFANIKNLTPNTQYSFSIRHKEITDYGKENEGSFKTLPYAITINAHPTHHRNSVSNIASNIININTLNGKKFRIVAACDYKNNTVKNKAANVTSQSTGSFNLAQVCDLFDYCFNNWHYVNDPSFETFQSASTSINNGLRGDCEDFAILLSSMLISLGGDARITTAYKDSSSGHAYAEINLGRANMQDVANYIAARYKKEWTGNIHYRVDSYKNCWLNLDWSTRHPGGEYYSGKTGTRYFILDKYCEDF